MVICSACGSEVGPKASICPRCREPVDSTGHEVFADLTSKASWLKRASIVLVLLALGLAAFFVEFLQ
jgi:predicted amidophosphoribosyltransferase